MPKTDIDYSNTIIYKITCKDPTVNHVYVGHTTNFVQRKYAHKQNCINTKSPNYKFKLYEVIRNHNGWDNWNMEIVNFFNCKDLYEARQKEQEYFILFKATLNSNEPLASPKPKPKPKPNPKPNNVTISIKECKEKKIYYCEQCKVHFNNHGLLEKHNDTNKHKAIVSGEKATLEASRDKNGKGFYCESCNFKCYKESNYKIHLLTPKHMKITEVYTGLQKNAAPEKVHVCKCSKI